MASLPALSGRDVVRVFARDGWQMARQRGSHMILVKDGHMATLSVPDHREVAKGTLREPDPVQRPEPRRVRRPRGQVVGTSPRRLRD